MFEFWLGKSVFGFAVRAVVVFIALILIALFFAMTAPTAHAADAMVGDSIAVGTGHAMRVPTYARSSMGSCWIARNEPLGPFDRLGLSAGINDSGACVAQLRARVRARQVTWILPAPINVSRRIVADVAAVYGDRTVSYSCGRRGCSKMNFHPASYAAVAAAVRSTWRAN